MSKRIITIWLVLMINFFLGTGLVSASNIGPVLPVVRLQHNQQNPAVVALIKKGYWFVAWEDWRDPLNADIYGAFVKIAEAPYGEEECLQRGYTWYRGHCYKGAEVCSTFPIVKEEGHQFSPAVAYDPDDQKIIVVWKDQVWPYLHFRFLDPPSVCYGKPKLYRIQDIPYNPIFDCTTCRGQCVCQKKYSYQEICKLAGYNWNPCDSKCYSYTYKDTGDCLNKCGEFCYSDEVYEEYVCRKTPPLEDPTTGQRYYFSWNEEQQACYAQGTFRYYTQDICNEDVFYFDQNFWNPLYVCNTEEICRSYCSSLEGSWTEFDPQKSYIEKKELEVENLTSRSAPKVVYNPHDRSFWFAWVENHTGLNKIRAIACYEEHYHHVPNLFMEYYVGQGIYPAYAQLSVKDTYDWDDLSDSWVVVDVLRSRGNLAGGGRFLKKDIDIYIDIDKFYRYVDLFYEVFTQIDEISLAPDLRNGGVFLVWGAHRQKVKFHFNCTAQYVNYETEDFPKGQQIFGLPHALLSEEHFPAIQISCYTNGQNTSCASAGVFHPAIEYDPVSGKFLVVWESTCGAESGDCTGANTPRIYGQLLEGLSGSLYLNNFLLTSPEMTGAEVWSYLKQTNPDIEWDPVNQRFFVAWQDNRAGSVSIENIDIWGQHVDPEGSLRGENMLVSATEEGQPTAGNQLAPKIAYDPETGIYLAVWKDARNYAETGSDVYAQAFSVGQSQLAVLDEGGKPIHPTVLDFGGLRVGEKKSLSFYLQNTGDAVLKICELSVLNDPFSYLLIPQVFSDGDLTTCLELQPGMKEEIMVEFSPSEEGSFSQTLKIISNAGERTLILQGGVRPVISVDQTLFDFGEVLIGNARSFTFTLVNHSNEEVEVRNISIPVEVFSIEGLTVGSAVPPGGTLTARVVFRPEAPQPYATEATLTFSRGGSLSFTFRGAGKEGQLSFEPGELNFGTTRIGNSKTLSFKITNHGNRTFVLTSIEGIEAPFELNGLEAGLELSPGSSLEGEVTFSPGERGLYEQELRLVFQQEGEIVSVTYFLRGEALELPACFYTNLPERVMLYQGISPLWFFSVTGDDDLLLSRFQEPALLGYNFLINEPGNYLLVLYPPQNLEPYTYRDRAAFLFDGARRRLEARSNLIVSTAPPGWSSCLPDLSFLLNSKRALRFKNGALPATLTLSLGLSWPCAPEGIRTGKVYLKVTSPGGSTFYYDLSRGFVPYTREYRVSPPLTFQDEIVIPLPSSLEEGLWLFELALDAGGEHFYAQGALVINKLPGAFCQTVDLAD